MSYSGLRLELADLPLSFSLS